LSFDWGDGIFTTDGGTGVSTTFDFSFGGTGVPFDVDLSFEGAGVSLSFERGVRFLCLRLDFDFDFFEFSDDWSSLEVGVPRGFHLFNSSLARLGLWSPRLSDVWEYGVFEPSSLDEELYSSDSKCA
jgi:hypothetical protein